MIEYENDPPSDDIGPGEAGTTRRNALERAGMVLGAGALAGLLGALSGPENAAAQGGGGRLGRGVPGGRMLFVTFFSTLNYFDGHKEGFRDAVRAFGGGRFSTVGPAGPDPAAELVEVQRATAQKIPMAVCCFEDKLFARPIDKALAAGVPVVTVDGGSPSSKASHVGTGNLQAGITAGERMIKEIGGQGQVLLTRQQTQNPSFIQREQGFKQAVAATGGKVKIAAVINDFDNAEKAATAVGQALQRNRDIDGIFTISAGAGLGTVRAVQQANLSRLKVGVFSNDKAVYQVLRQRGPLTFVAAQETYKMGFFSAVMLMLAATRVIVPDYKLGPLGVKFPLPESTDTGLAIVDRKNVGAFL